MAADALSGLRGQDAAVRSYDRADDRIDALRSLVDKEGPAQGMACRSGEFIWREAGSRHVAWCPEGALVLAIFQVPNKFFEADGRVVDAAGQDWDETWGHTKAS
jgi:hypothetical protein